MARYTVRSGLHLQDKQNNYEQSGEKNELVPAAGTIGTAAGSTRTLEMVAGSL